MGNILKACAHPCEFDDEGISEANVQLQADLPPGAQLEFVAEIEPNRIFARAVVFSEPRLFSEPMPIPNLRKPVVMTKMAFSLSSTTPRGSFVQREFFNPTQSVAVAKSLSRSSSAEHMNRSYSEDHLRGLSTSEESLPRSVRLGRGF